MEIKILDVMSFNEIKGILQEYKKSINETIIEEKQFNELKNAVVDNRITFYVAIKDNDIIGVCSISTIFSTYKCETVGIFDDFFIRKEYRGQGYARKMVNFVFHDMKAKGINSALVGCSEIDIGMYNKLGFDMELGFLLSWDGK